MVQLLVNTDDEGMAQMTGQSIDPAKITKEELDDVLALPKNVILTVEGIVSGQTFVVGAVSKPKAVFLAVNGAIAGAAARQYRLKAAGGIEAFLRCVEMPAWAYIASQKATNHRMTLVAKSAVRKMERTKVRQEVSRGEVVQIGVVSAVQPPSVGTDLGLAERQAKRRDALMRMRDLWDLSNAGLEKVDGVEYQKAMRAEW